VALYEQAAPHLGGFIAFAGRGGATQQSKGERHKTDMKRPFPFASSSNLRRCRLSLQPPARPVYKISAGGGCNPGAPPPGQRL